MNRFTARMGWTAAACLLMCASAFADPHVRVKPDDYMLKSDLTLSTGQVLPAGTVWYRPPDVARLQRELSAATYKGDAAQAKRILFGYRLLYSTYNTIGDGRKDGRPHWPKGA